MREILFRGKRKDNGEWVEGFPVRIYDYGGLVWDMHPFNTNLEVTHSVIPNSIGQFTGLKDKNGKKIFEGDIVKQGEHIMLVEWYEFLASFALAFSVDGYYHEAISNSHIYLEVIGNIHDNPELLKGGAEDA